MSDQVDALLGENKGLVQANEALRGEIARLKKEIIEYRKNLGETSSDWIHVTETARVADKLHEEGIALLKTELKQLKRDNVSLKKELNRANDVVQEAEKRAVEEFKNSLEFRQMVEVACVNYANAKK